MQFIDSPVKTDRSALSRYSFSDTTFISACVADVKDTLLENPPIVVYGKPAMQHRSIGFFSDSSKGYRYSGQFAPAQPLSTNLQTLLVQVNANFGTEFNGLLVNKYSSGLDYIGPHSDDETYLDACGVVSISFGVSRNFRIRDKRTKVIVANVPTDSGIILHMSGAFQKEFTHEIPKETKVDGVRYSFTFRKHLI